MTNETLRGIRVLDLTRLIPGPFATLLLADLGARVDKIEDPGAGDYLRPMPPQVGGMSATFVTLNRGKRSAVIDLKKAEGVALFRRLAARTDVIVESFRPGVMDKLGLGYDVLRADNPRLVYAALTGYGQDGPLSKRAGHDLNYLSRAGVLGMQGPNGGPPQVPGVQMADVGGGLWCAMGILAALYARERTGVGRFVDVAMTDGAMPFGAFGFGPVLASGSSAPRGGDPLSGGIAPYATYRTADGRHVSLAALEPKFWIAFCQATGIEIDLGALVPGDHQPKLREQVAGVIGGKTRDEWEAFAVEHDCCLEPVLEPHELLADAHAKARGVLVRGPAPNGTEMLQLSTPLVRDIVPGPAPTHGAHTDAVLADYGIDATEVASLRATKIVR
ncbi:MAG: CoA transferase [Deltaproteobacteria bacterium]|nr:CoA transferase [Deltaproteobacteria bacterium]